MVIIDLLKDIGTKPICISKKLGLYLKNSNKDELYINVKDLVESNYINNLDKNINFRSELINFLDDQYYENCSEEYKEKISSLTKFGDNIDKYIADVDDFFKLDFIIENMIMENLKKKIGF